MTPTALAGTEEPPAALSKDHTVVHVVDLWNTIKRHNRCILGVPEGESKEKGAGSFLKEIMAENSPKLGRHLDTQIHEAHRSQTNSI